MLLPLALAARGLLQAGADAATIGGYEGCDCPATAKRAKATQRLVRRCPVLAPCWQRHSRNSEPA